MKKSHLEQSIPNLSLSAQTSCGSVLAHLLQERVSLVMAEWTLYLWRQKNVIRTQFSAMLF